MKKFNAAKSIGLVLYLDGKYRPSNDRSSQKLQALFTLHHAPIPEITGGNLAQLRALAQQDGYKIFTSRKCL